jgi:hypothetical protein
VKLYFVPKTLLGKWSLGLFAGLVIFFLIARIIVASGQEGGETFFSNLSISIPMLLAGLSGVTAFFTGIIGIIKSKERSVLTFIATIIGFFILVFVSAELVSPH